MENVLRTGTINSPLLVMGCIVRAFTMTDYVQVHYHATAWISFTTPVPIHACTTKPLVFSEDVPRHHMQFSYPLRFEVILGLRVFSK